MFDKNTPPQPRPPGNNTRGESPRQPPTVPREYYVVPTRSNVKGCPSHGKEPPEIETREQYEQYKEKKLNRKLSLIFHPDRNPECAEDATIKFQKIKQYEDDIIRLMQQGLRGGRKKSMKLKSKKQQKHNKTKKLKINKKNMKK
jgi:hypothetical protein